MPLAYAEKTGFDPDTRMALIFFILAFLIRVFFLLATPDANGPFSPYYKGDTPVWLDYASAILSSSQFNMGLPMRPPGVAYLVAMLWGGSSESYLMLKLAWAVMGAASVAIFYIAVVRSFGFRVAVMASLIMAASTGLMIASTAPNNETPYILLLVTGMAAWKFIQQKPTWRMLLVWSLINGIACLIRVEHVLFFALTSTWLCWSWAHQPGEQSNWKYGLLRLAVMVGLFSLALLPWQLHIGSGIARFNNEPLPEDKVTNQASIRLEQGLAVMEWTDGALLERESLPAFARRTMSNFVGATVAMRGRLIVKDTDFNIIEEAFGYRPEPVHPYPFVSIYGGLNFFLANNPAASGGFSLAPLDNPPLLSGGRTIYPAFLIEGLPPPELTLSYPPHLEIINHGYALGWEWMRNHPADMLRLVFQKLRHFWSGVSMGFTGYNLPLGLSGTRKMVDMVVPDSGPGVMVWRATGLFLLLGGLWVGRRQKALIPWVLLLTTKVISTVFFFGYAREGLVVIPVFALLLALFFNSISSAIIPAMKSSENVAPRHWIHWVLILSVVLIAIETARWSSRPVVRLDGGEVGVVEPFPASDYRQRRLQVN